MNFLIIGWGLVALLIVFLVIRAFLRAVVRQQRLVESLTIQAMAKIDPGGRLKAAAYFNSHLPRLMVLQTPEAFPLLKAANFTTQPAPALSALALEPPRAADSTPEHFPAPAQI